MSVESQDTVSIGQTTQRSIQCGGICKACKTSTRLSATKSAEDFWECVRHIIRLPALIQSAVVHVAEKARSIAHSFSVQESRSRSPVPGTVDRLDAQLHQSLQSRLPRGFTVTALPRSMHYAQRINQCQVSGVFKIGWCLFQVKTVAEGKEFTCF